MFPEPLGHLRRLPKGFELGFWRLVEVKSERYTCTRLKEGNSAPECIPQTPFPNLEDPNINVSGDQGTLNLMRICSRLEPVLLS